MDRESYFVITSGEDGISIDTVSREELEKRLKQDYYGTRAKFLEQMPKTMDGYFDMRHDDKEYPVVVVKGRVIVPKAVQKVTEYEVE